jgi:hypothetical protein
VARATRPLNQARSHRGWHHLGARFQHERCPHGSNLLGVVARLASRERVGVRQPSANPLARDDEQERRSRLLVRDNGTVVDAPGARSLLPSTTSGCDGKYRTTCSSTAAMRHMSGAGAVAPAAYSAIALQASGSQPEARGRGRRRPWPSRRARTRARAIPRDSISRCGGTQSDVGTTPKRGVITGRLRPSSRRAATHRSRPEGYATNSAIDSMKSARMYRIASPYRSSASSSGENGMYRHTSCRGRSSRANVGRRMSRCTSAARRRASHSTRPTAHGMSRRPTRSSRIWLNMPRSSRRYVRACLPARLRSPLRTPHNLLG